MVDFGGDSMPDRLEKVERGLERVERQLSTLQTDVNEQCEHVNRRFEQIDQRFGLMDQHFEQMEESIAKNRPAYRREGMTEIKVNGQEGAVWEFSYQSLDGSGRRHLKEAEFRTEDGTSYGLLVASPEKDWQDALRRFTIVLNHFSVEG